MQWHLGLVGVAVILIGAVATAVPAAAHSEIGVLGIEVTPGASARTANVRVLLEFSGDRHVVPGATVVAAATGPNGAVVPETPMTDRGEGRYEVTLTMPEPGAWTVTATSVDPVATATSTVVVSDEPPPATTSPPPLTDVRESSGERADSRRQDDGHGDEGGVGLALIGVVAVVVVAVGAAAVARRRGRARH